MSRTFQKFEPAPRRGEPEVGAGRGRTGARGAARRTLVLVAHWSHACALDKEHYINLCVACTCEHCLCLCPHRRVEVLSYPGAALFSQTAFRPGGSTPDYFLVSSVRVHIAVNTEECRMLLLPVILCLVRRWCRVCKAPLFC